MRGLAFAVVSVILSSTVLAWGQPAGPAPAQAPAPATTPPRERESWDAVFINNVKVGYNSLKVTPIADRGRNYVRVEVKSQLNVKRANDAATIKSLYGAVESADGRVLRMDSKTDLGGGQDLRVKGDLRDGKMKIELTIGGRTNTQDIPWGNDVRGPYGPELELYVRPMAPGESRKFKVFIPQYNQLALVTLQAKGNEDVALAKGIKRTLLRVESKVTREDGAPMVGMDTIYFVDNSGEILKSTTDVFGGMVTLRTSKDAALAKGGDLDLIQATIVRPRTRITSAYNTRGLVYQVTLKDAEVAKVFAADRRQKIEPSADPKVAKLTVTTMGPAAGQPGPETVEAAFLAPNPMINSQDPQVLACMRQAVGQLTDPWAKAAAITDWVSKNLTDKNFETTFATAADVARDRSGDCTEHSVLTAAMCRAAGIPARVAIGLVYVEQLGGFGFHMWDEVYVNRRWVAVDAAFQQTDVDAVHLKLSDSSMDGVSPFQEFEKVIQVCNKVQIEPIEIR